MPHTMKRRILLILSAAVSALVVVLLFMLIGQQNKFANMIRGIQEGFELKGTYVPYSGSGPISRDPSVSIYFDDSAEDATITWGSRTRETFYVTGTATATEDPHIYMLTKATVERYGIVHLNYMNAGEGMLYFSKDGEHFERYALMDEHIAQDMTDPKEFQRTPEATS
ncbi:hypothetical protein K6V98_02060 [Collinsella sp. AGMB00827]|uniref:DUF4860 domain-containing protein n=1 Tax=Collinsella ureilytica TaxID=2869515 RepID=A0ABS7MIG6_9ACTN|nr:hypothetical protein [Collinsella urealyticum]MBY4797149.1 hypothetical protein [Collinsella urealyticum]